MKKVIAILILGMLAVVAGCHMGPRGPFCQSCAMPMDKPELFGTETDGTPSAEYCTYCYQDGAFTEPDITMEEMIDKCVEQMVAQDVMPEDKARSMMTKYLPRMKRWQSE